MGKFEDLCLDIFREQWGDTYSQKNGRRGQPQCGVDIWGYPREAPGELHGVQCKGKDILYGGLVTEAELENEVAKALKFNPRLDHWLLVTTAPKHSTIEEAARRISARHHLAGLFTVNVFGWEDLRTRIADSDKLMTKHYPDQAPRQREILARIGSIESNLSLRNVSAAAMEGETRAFQTATAGKLDALFLLVQGQITSSPESLSAAEAILQARIDDLRTFIQEHQPATALKQAERLIAECWQDASSLARFRLLANKAAALFNLSRNEEGALTSLEALTFAPEDARAIVYAAQGHIFLGQVEKARVMLDRLLSREPNNDDALAIRIAASIDEGVISDPYWAVPDRGLIGWNVLLSVARWFRHRGRQDEASVTFKATLQAQPERLEVMAEVASYTLEFLFRDKAAIFIHRLEPKEFEELRGAVDLLTKVWDLVKPTELRDSYLWSVYNLCNALRYLSDYDGAAARITETLSLVPNDKNLLQQKALIEAATGKHEQLLLTLDRIGSEDGEALLMRSDALASLNRPEEALLALEGFPKASQRLQVAVAGSRIKLLITLGKIAEAFTVATETAATFAENALARLIVSEFYRWTDQKPMSLLEAQAAVTLLNHDATDDGLAGLIVAESLSNLGDWEGAAELLTEVGDARHDSDALRLRVQALLNAGRRQELRGLLSTMPPAIANIPIYAQAAAWLYRLSGDYPSARTFAETYLSQVPDDLNMRLMWLDTAERQDDQASIQTYLSGNVEHLRGSGQTGDLMALSQFMVRHGLPERGLDLGYSTLRSQWSKATAHLGFFRLMTMAADTRAAIPTPTFINSEVSFTVENEVGRRRTYVIETGTDPKIELNEISPTSRLAIAAMGRTVGDSIRVNDNDLVPEERVVELAHKYISLFHRSLREFNTLFPDNNSLVEFNFDPTHPEQILDRMRVALTARAAAGREMLEQYRTSMLPVAFAARAIGLDPVEGWNVIHQSKVLIDVCLGVEKERDGAANLLRSYPPLIIDPMTFWIAGILGVLDSLTKTFGPLGITASAIELLVERERNAINNRDQGWGVMFEQDGQIGMVQPTDDEKRQPVELATRLLAWARANAAIVPAFPDEDLPPEFRRLAEMAHPSVIDTLVAAKGSGRGFVCEDRRLRLLGSEIGVERSVWLQPTLLACTSARNITINAYSDALLDLSLWGHQLTSLDGQTLLRATARWGDESLVYFRQVVERLASPNLEARSLLIVASSFLQELWKQPRARATKDRFSAIVLDACRRANPKIPSALAMLLERPLLDREHKMAKEDAQRLKQGCRYLRQWLVANPERG